MTPVAFLSCNAVFGENQPEYLPLPARVDDDGCVTTRWEFTWGERLRILFGGTLFIDVLTFHHKLQPIRPRVVPVGQED